MTVAYSGDIFTSGGNAFLKLLFKWRGSFYKLVWKDLIFYILAYVGLSLIYRFLLPPEGKAIFEEVSLLCGKFSAATPVTFILGFYVSILVTRWWAEFLLIPWPDSTAVMVSTYIEGNDEEAKLLKRTIMRYINLSIIMTLRAISLPVKKRFPTIKHLEQSGLIFGREFAVFEKLKSKADYWIPLVWAGTLVKRARKENRIPNDSMVLAIIQELNLLRKSCGGVQAYDWVNIPLVYTQVVTLVVHSYVLSSLMGEQYLEIEKGKEGHSSDFIFPWFSIIEFSFYMGLLRVAECLINPFGEDDDDFETNWMIDRNLEVCYLIVDEMHSDPPHLVKDQFWDMLYPKLPHTEASQKTNSRKYTGGTGNYRVPSDKCTFLDPIPEYQADKKLVDNVVGGHKSAIDRRKQKRTRGEVGIVVTEPEEDEIQHKRRKSIMDIINMAFKT